MAKSRFGIWLVGAKGGVATTTILGLSALKRGLVGSVGLVSELPQFQHLELSPWTDFLVGGHEIRLAPLCGEALRLAKMRAVSAELIAQCRDDLDEIETRIRPGTLYNVGPTIAGLADLDLPRDKTPRQAVARLQHDLKEFAQSNALEHVVVVNVASTEPAVSAAKLPPSWAALAPLLDCPDCPLPASSLYAIAALDLGCSYINFTPSLGRGPAGH